jgi:transposase
MDKRASDLDKPLIDKRDAWQAVAHDPDIKVKLEALRAYEKVLDDHINLRQMCIYYIKEAAKQMFPIVTDRSKSFHSAFWNSLGVTEADYQSVMYQPTPMALSK